MSRLRDDSQRTAAESTRAPRLALEQQQELEPKTLEQQLKDNEACGYEKGAMGILSQAIKGARLRKWEISRECFNLVCRALQIPCNGRCNGSFQGKKFILVLYIKTDPFTNLTPCVHQHASTVTFAAICHRPVINNLGDAIMNHEAVVLLVPAKTGDQRGYSTMCASKRIAIGEELTLPNECNRRAGAADNCNAASM